MNDNGTIGCYNPSLCCFCQSPEFDIVTNGPVFEIIQCRKCGFMRQGASETKTGYSFIGYAGSKQRFIRQRKDKERIQIQDFKSIIPQLDNNIPQKGSLLEIGCAMGATLHEFQKAGWEVTGVEPEEWTCNEARKKYGLNVINARFQEAGFEENSFDVIIVLHVIEHLPDPFKGIQFLYSLLKPGGILVIETPRYDTITFKLLKGRERSVIPGHLYYYTRETLLIQAQKAGFLKLRLDSVGRTVTLDRLSFYAAKLLNTKFTTKIISYISDTLHLNKAHLYINLHDMMRGYLQKPLT